MVQIKSITAREVLDSRGNPTVEAEVLLTDGSLGTASVPSGASRGQNEAWELRDGDPERYNGKGVLTAVGGVNEMIAPALIGASPYDSQEIDSVMIALDATANKSRLGANATLSVSMAVCRAAAESLGLPLYRYLGGALLDRMPVPMMNILNGGVHADNNLDVQEFMIVPIGAATFAEAVRIGSTVYHSLKRILKDGKKSVSVGDEGGFAPMLDGDGAALSLICEAIEHSGYKVGEEVAIALDIASSEWYSGGEYRLPKQNKTRSSEELCSYLLSLVEKYPIISVEDGMADTDFAGWQRLTETLRSKRTILVGDDLFVTDYKRIEDGVRRSVANAALIKPNQIGTVSECAEAVHCAHLHGYKTAMSHRSGETEDSFIADLAVALGTHFIKSGAPARGERTAKYNRLMKIEEELFDSFYGF